MTRPLLSGADLRGTLELSGGAGATGQLLQSAGPGQIPTWGRRISVGATAPSSPSEGDIWIETP
jgi:hypothetical protein